MRQLTISICIRSFGVTYALCTCTTLSHILQARGFDYIIALQLSTCALFWSDTLEFAQKYCALLYPCLRQTRQKADKDRL